MTLAQYDPATYQLCATPRPRAEVEASLAAFDAELAELRIKHRIAEVVCVVEVHVTGERSVTACIHRGDSRLHPHLLGAAYLSMTGGNRKSEKEEW